MVKWKWKLLSEHLVHDANWFDWFVTTISNSVLSCGFCLMVNFWMKYLL